MSSEPSSHGVGSGRASALGVGGVAADLALRRDHFGVGCSERRRYVRSRRGWRRPVPTRAQMRSNVSLTYAEWRSSRPSRCCARAARLCLKLACGSGCPAAACGPVGDQPANRDQVEMRVQFLLHQALALAVQLPHFQELLADLVQLLDPQRAWDRSASAPIHSSRQASERVAWLNSKQPSRRPWRSSRK